MKTQTLFNQPTQDGEFQSEICRTRGNQVVVAGAGSGKTYQLVQKYLYELLRQESENRGTSGSSVEHLAAITFTEKAAHEMKERIRSKLKELLRSSVHPFSDTLETLYRRMDGAYISTIHSFCARLLRENPGESGVDPQFSVMEEAESRALLKEVIRNIIDRGLRRNEPGICLLVDGFGYESKGYQENLPDILIKVHRISRTLGLPLHKLEEMYIEGVTALHSYCCRYLADIIEAVSFFKEHGGTEHVKRFLEQWDVREKGISGITLSECGEEELRDIRDLKNSVAGNWGRGEAKDFKMQLADGLAALEGMILDVLSRSVMNEVISLLMNADQSYTLRKQEMSVLDFNDLEEKALGLLKNHSRICEYYRNRFKLILVDEFQDTNPLQFQLLQALLQPDANHLFVVGDHKQSVYGFRGADISIFKRLYKGDSNLRPAKHLLKSCRRSTEGLIRNFFNPFFRVFMNDAGQDHSLESEIYTSRYEESDEMECHRKVKGLPVEILTFFTCTPRAADVRTAEAETLARRIKLLVDERSDFKPVYVYDEEEQPRPPMYGDVAVLFRSLTSLSIYREALRRHGIPHYLVKGRGFFQSAEVLDMANFLTFLNYMEEQIPLMGVLRSPMVCVKDETIYRLIRGTDGQVPLYSYFDSSGPPFPRDIAQEDFRKLTEFRQWFMELYGEKDRLLISEIIERAIEKSGVDAVYLGGFQGAQHLANLHKLIELARNFERQRAHILRDFIWYLYELTEADTGEAEAEITSENEDVVRLMSVHQAKGLQFPIVIIADVQGAGILSTQGKHALHPEQGLLIKPPDPFTNVPVSTFRWKEVSARQQAMEREELKRLLYVAATRARDHLIISGVYKPESNRLNRMVWLRGLLDYFGFSQEMQSNISKKNNCVVIPHHCVPDDSPLHATAPVLSLTPDHHVSKDKQANIPPALVNRITGRKHEPREHGVFTATDLNLFNNCPRLYFYQKFLGLKIFRHQWAQNDNDLSPEMATMEFQADLGTLAHWVLEHSVFTAEVEDINLRLEAGIRLFDLKLSPRDREELLHALVQTLHLPLFKELEKAEVFRERPFLLELTRDRQTVHLKGTMDLLIRKNGESLVIDYKYAEPKDGLEHYYDFQLMVYAAAAAAENSGEPVKSGLIYMKTDPPQLNYRDNLEREERESRIMEVCGKLLAKERETLRRKRHAAVTLWECNPDMCSVFNCDYLKECGL